MTTSGVRAYSGEAAEAYAAGILAGAAVERERILQRAGKLKFTLFRPGNGPAQGQALDVVPLGELEALLRDAP